MDTFEAYQRIRSRVCDLMQGAGDDQLQVTVPACPEWRVRDLLAHVVALPAAIGSGRLPSGDLQGWLDELVAERADQPVSDLVTEWEALDAPLQVLLNGGAALLFDDLAVHEHDLRGAMRHPDHSAFDAEEVMPRALASLGGHLQAAGLAPLAVWDRELSWQSHEGTAGWTILAPAWEACRAVSSRRTADELRALPGDG